jgi:hypothetical protein
VDGKLSTKLATVGKLAAEVDVQLERTLRRMAALPVGS